MLGSAAYWVQAMRRMVCNAPAAVVRCSPLLVTPFCCLQLQSRQLQLEADVASKQQQADDLVKDFKAVEDQIDKVCSQWTHPSYLVMPLLAELEVDFTR